MANDIKIYSAVSKEFLYEFDMVCVSRATMNTQYDKTYQDSGSNSGNTINIKQVQNFVVSDGATMVIQDYEERVVPLVRATRKHIGLGFTSQELTQDLLNDDKMRDFSDKNLAPAASRMAARMDADALTFAHKNTYNAIGTPGTVPNSYSAITSAKAVLVKNGASTRDRSFILEPDTMSSLNVATSSFFNPVTEKSEDYRDGMLAKSNKFTFWETDFIPRHQNGSCADTTLVVNGTQVEGSSTLAVSGGTASGVITAGSVISIAGVYRRNLETKEIRKEIQQFVVTEDATLDGSGAGALTISPFMDTVGPYASISALPANGAAITIEGDANTSYGLNLFYQKDAFVMATQDLRKIGTNKEFYIREDELGVTFKVSCDADIVNDKALSRMDVLYGFAAINPWWAGKLWSN